MEQQPKPEVKCSFCYHVLADDETRYSCANCTMRVCAGSEDKCFAGWVDGSHRDNRGFIAAKCYCGLEIAPAEVKRLMGSDVLYAKYDETMLRQLLLRGGECVFCPGPDCRNGFLRPIDVKGVSKCRSTNCGECATVFCVMCGERFEQGGLSHAQMDCKAFKKRLDEVNGVTQWAKEQKKDQLKACPGCKRLTQKNGGCSSHQCTLCGIAFCWKCTSPTGCRCHEKRQKKQRRYAKWAEKKKAKQGGAASVGGGNDNNAQVNVAAAAAASVASNSNDKLKPLVVGRAAVSNAFVVERGSRLEHQDLDVVILAKSEMKALRIAEAMDGEQRLKTTRRRAKKKKVVAAAVADLAQLSKKERTKARKAAKWVQV